LIGRIPPFENEFIEVVAQNFRKRLKSLRHSVSTPIEVDKVYREVGGDNVETLELNLSGRRDRPKLRMVVWHNRFVSLDARIWSKRNGWLWEWTFDGRLSGDKSGIDLVQAIETTLARLPDMDKTRTSELTAIWSALLARGPIEVR